MGTKLRGAIIVLLGLVASSTALAQDGAPPPPTRPSIDDKSVNLTTGELVTSVTDISIGPNDHHGLQYVRQWVATQWRQASVPVLSGSTSSVIVTFEGNSTKFTWNGSAYVGDDISGSTLSADRAVFTESDGTVVNFETSDYPLYYTQSNLGRASSIVFPDGTTRKFNYADATYFTDYCVGGECNEANISRLSSIVSSTGYQLKLSYASNSLTNSASRVGWSKVTRVTAINGVVDYCNPVSGCTPSSSWPYVSYTGTNGNIVTVTDAENRVTTYGYTSNKLTSVRIPDATVNTVDITYATGTGKVDTVKNAGQTWTYSYGTGTTSVSDPFSHSRSIAFNATSFLVSSSTNENGYVTNFTYCGASEANCPVNLLKKVTFPEGNGQQFEYDTRGNRTKVTLTPKTGSSETTMQVWAAAYPVTCTNQKICNKPTVTSDQSGQITNYEYDASSGIVSKITAPAPAVGQARPEVRTTFITMQAWIKASSGTGVVLDTSGATRAPLTISSCSSGSAPSCVGTANETVTELAYEGSGTTRGTNLLLDIVTNRSGNNDTAQREAVTYDYDDIGNPVRVIDGTNSEYQMSYNKARQMLYRWTPDPDGAGSLLPRMERTSYGVYGLPEYTAYGTYNPSTQAFTAMEYRYASYDGYGRPILSRATRNGVDYAATQTSYDVAGRTDCVAVRMNPSTYSSLPAACTLGTQGSFGPDRIVKYAWESAHALAQLTSGYGTPLQRDDAQYTRNLNGSVTKILDAKGNATSYQYDGHDRLIRTCFNTATCTSAAADKYFLAYGTSGNAAGRVVQQGLRGHAETIYTSYAYDALGRVTNTDYPGPGFYDQDISYVYDNFGQVKEVNDANTHSVRYQYDALGRVTSQGDQAQSLTMQYDGAGRRKRLTWSDGFYVTYDYDGTGAMIAIRENGGGALASFTYEALGRRASLALANGSTTNYSYNSGFGLTDLDINLYGTTRDLAVDFTYNPAGQIATRFGSNGNYAWAGHASVNRNYGANGLNQYTAVGAVTPTYDVKGNLSSAPTIISNSTYAYNVNNILVASFNGSTMQYQFYPDPIGRMKIIGTASAWTRGFEYDGGNIVTERRPSDQAIMHRYVFGPGDDEPLVWYDYSSGTLAKKYLTADERGSIIAVTSNSGSVLNVNTYDDFGVPASGNMGMFGYTGQAWIAELGMYHYKARTYSPTLGRFLQTDPIGYGDGMNWYNYVGGDPVNSTDPTGMALQSCHTYGGGPTTFSSGTIGVTGFVTRCQTIFGPGEIGGVSRGQGSSGGLIKRLKDTEPSKAEPQRTQTPTPCQKAFLKDQLGSRGLPTSQIDNLRFVSGLDSNANALTRSAFNGGAGAVTQGSTVYVQPGGFDTVANFRSPTGFEEAYHTAQFASNRGFYTTYGLLSLGGLLSTGDSYNGNLYEAFAKGASKQMFEASKTGMCPR